jgi:hypothetical protein
MEVTVWRQRAPQASFRERVAGSGARVAAFRARMAGSRERIAGWRARNWRRAVLAWSVLCLICVAISAEPGAAFPKAQARSVPGVGMIMKVAGGLTVVGGPALLIVLP